MSNDNSCTEVKRECPVGVAGCNQVPYCKVVLVCVRVAHVRGQQYTAYNKEKDV